MNKRIHVSRRMSRNNHYTTIQLRWIARNRSGHTVGSQPMHRALEKEHTLKVRAEATEEKPPLTSEKQVTHLVRPLLSVLIRKTKTTNSAWGTWLSPCRPCSSAFLHTEKQRRCDTTPSPSPHPCWKSDPVPAEQNCNGDKKQAPCAQML